MRKLRVDSKGRLIVACLLLCGIASGTQVRGDDDNGEPPRRPATTVQLPTFGVAIDAAGVFAVEHFPDPGRRQWIERAMAARRNLPAELARGTAIRVVSLRRLEQHLRLRVAQKGDWDAEARYLAGLQRVRFVAYDAERKDVLFAGPAEGFAADASGRVVGLTSGRPPLRLDDLAVALRSYVFSDAPPPFVGCTISPRRQSLERLVAFQKQIPRVIPERERLAVGRWIAAGSRDALGDADITVFGVSAETHLGLVMVEADYRMKRMGIGLEPAPPKVVTYLEALKGVPQGMLQRWWFTPDYDRLSVSPDRHVIEFVGRGVRLNSSDLRIGPDGALHTEGDRVAAANKAYADSFTTHYDEIADAAPVYAELQNVVDVLVCAAAIRRFELLPADASCGAWLADEDNVATRTEHAPVRTPCLVNAVWKRNRLLAPAGGVAIVPAQAVSDEHLIISPELAPRGAGLVDSVPADDRWWWDLE